MKDFFLKKDPNQTSKDEMPEVINILGGINTRLNIVDEKISELEVIVIEAIQSETYSRKKTQEK